MRLIDQVEIAYFRSIYKENLNSCTDTNIVFGRNDSGKSNILRALNLFFNKNTSPGLEFNFLQDFNHSRRAEAGGDGDIRKFVYVKIWFNTPQTWRRSLGDRFWVKKQWSISFGSDAQVTTSISENKRNYLSRFLNKIRLYYIPAIKDRKIFESLQAEIYKVISEHIEFSGSLLNFTNALRERTQGLSQQLLQDLNISSVVTTPKDLTDLFRSLDFETTSEVGDAYSLTLQRGDGVQVRHIAPILSFLAEHSSEDFHVWAFEEPENSLELVNAIEEANRFRSFGQQPNKQIFLTSHSPAFFSLEQDDVSRYFVTRSKVIEERLNSTIVKIGSPRSPLPSELMGETPHLPVISVHLRDAHLKILQQEENRIELEQRLEAHNQSIMFVEGASDIRVFAKAWEMLIGNEMPFRLESAGGTTKMESLASDGRILSGLAPGRKIFALVDNDTEGRSLYANSRLSNGGRWVQHNSNKVHWCRLPFATEFERFMTQIGLPKTMWPGSLENFFSPAIRNRAVMAGALQLTSSPHAEIIDRQHFSRIQPYLAPREDLNHFHILTTHEDSKVSFADWIVGVAEDEPEILEPLRIVFEGVMQILAAD
ncbi:AAA domain-containing protein, putative AbiEii toxin, Type IV TA system [Pseudomonas benzenivorans]|nr:AAA family ATPase [Pseudomonas benzenivorans]SDI25389.1 AAA domain-containing protein, putative AbiEii toxin, Type IV TA system [Pseudomonas benzenivorans]